MHIHGNKVNSVIQWGGGFNINKGESVNFGGNSKNYLNIAHGTNKSTIAGILNAKDNNVFLINPNGVIIKKDGIINANRFVASTLSMSDGDIRAFANMKTFDQGNSFSPVFKPNSGNVINMGNINANDVLLIGHKVDIQGGKVGNKNSTTHLVGNDLVLNPSSFAENKTNNITALNSVELSASMSAFEDGEYKFVGGDSFTLTNYTDNNNKLTENKVQKIDFKQYLTIDSVGEWAIFANAWNNNKGDTRKVKEFRLINNIDFNNDFKPEYMVGYGILKNGAYDWSNSFSSTFNGNGYTLSNIKLDTSKGSYKDYYIGIFGSVIGGTIKNLKVKNVDITSYKSAGSIVGYSENGNYHDISLDNISIYSKAQNAGGFAGRSEKDNAFERISLNDVKKVVSDASYANAGAFIGITGGGIFRDISINNVGLVKGYMVGGFGGYLVTNLSGNGVEEAKNVIFENIKLTNIGTKGDDNTGIISSGSFAGGFFASMQNYDRDDTKINNIYMQNISQIKSGQDAAGFTTQLGAGSVSNIHIENIGKIESTSIGKSSVAGFIGDVKNGIYKNISVKNIESIVSRSSSSQAWSGGFIGSANAGTFENITFSGVGSMSYNGYYFGLFIGQVGDSWNKDNRVILKNIIVHDIGDLKCEGWSCDRGDFSGFIGDFGGKANLENIHIFLDKNYEQANILFSDFTWVSMDDINFNNVNMYYKQGTFSNVKNKEEYYKGKINFIKYNENELANKKQEFITSAQTATGLQYDKTSNSFQTTADFKVKNPIFTTIGEGGDNPNEVKLDENDLLQEMIKKEIIADITNGKYKLHISDLLKMLEDKANYSNMSEEQKVEFVAKYFLSGDKTKALEVVQSLDFLLAYEKNGLSTASNDKFKGNGFSTKESILKQVNNTTKNIKDKINQLNDELKSLANDSKGFLKDLIAKQNELDVVIKAYNKYVVLINKGLAHKNDPEFVILKNKIDTLMKDSQDLAILINTKQNELSIWQNKNNTENFKVIGAFANGVLNTNPKLDQIKGDGGEGEDPNKPELPEIDLEFEQTASLNLIGDESLEEEEEEHEIEEAALTQRARTCIVSDNFKTMNPCVVESY
ncbi:two-partner secretion domain-containing protein [Campylobacter peloridis]|uniref:two-partner secretion domain-containing protein n=1 Tax=Campylobacter peloridis TaxID=488546 RepID=UPI002176C311|nr:filamentous hemagglutinin N-terminal domain-containing protein [Campylobacter peloridis]